MRRSQLSDPNHGHYVVRKLAGTWSPTHPEILVVASIVEVNYDAIGGWHPRHNGPAMWEDAKGETALTLETRLFRFDPERFMKFVQAYNMDFTDEDFHKGLEDLIRNGIIRSDSTGRIEFVYRYPEGHQLGGDDVVLPRDVTNHNLNFEAKFLYMYLCCYSEHLAVSN